MIAKLEHQKIDPQLLQGLDLDKLRRRINYSTSRFDSSMVNLIRYEFDPEKHREGFFSYFRIGAEWLDEDQTRYIAVMPKMQSINFIEMFMTCLRTNESADDFSSIYDIDFEARPIRSKALSSILSALLVVQYLMTLKLIVARGLRKGYVQRQQNLAKVKGRLDIRRTEHNVMLGHQERVFCLYDEYLVDTLENKLLKRALVVAGDMLSLMREHSSYPILSAMLNQSMSSFSDVSDDGVVDLHNIKANKLYKEYDEAIRLAKMIIRRQDIAVNSHRVNQFDTVPVFRIDMALLFEHYALAKMRQTFGQDAVMYQVKGYQRRFIADFLIKKGDTRLIADTKYVDGSDKAARKEYISQLSGYARDHVLLRRLGYDPDNEPSIPIVPCVVLYPSEHVPTLTPTSLLTHPVSHTMEFYTFPICIPTYN